MMRWRHGITSYQWLVLFVAWLAWFFLARVTVYEVSKAARLEVDQAAFPVQAQVSGRVVRMPARLDQRVCPEDVLLELDSAPQQLELARARTQLEALGPQIENHPLFPRRTNVQLVRVRDRHTVEALIWERGAGYTLSSGSSSCAVAAACVRAGLVERQVKVVMPGGTLEVIVGEQWRLEQIGFAQEIARLRLSADLLAAL